MGKSVLSDSEIRVNGMKALNKALGPSATMRFMTLIYREPTDYVQISRDLYKDQTVDEIFARAKANWRD